jgi:hypothetical protein
VIRSGPMALMAAVTCGSPISDIKISAEPMVRAASISRSSRAFTNRSAQGNVTGRRSVMATSHATMPPASAGGSRS